MSRSSLRHPTPIGVLTLVAEGGALLGVYFEDHAKPVLSAPTGAETVLDAARRQLDAYFQGRRRRFDLPLSPLGTPFQVRVWALIAGIAYGETWTYAGLAAALGAPLAARAVGAAVGRNPLSIIIPCHRVLGAGGSLTGYAGGLERKRQLLALERGDPTLPLK